MMHLKGLPCTSGREALWDWGLFGAEGCCKWGCCLFGAEGCCKWGCCLFGG